MPPLRSHKRRRVACQHFPDDQTLRLQAGAGEDDVIHLPSGLDRVDCERQEEEEEQARDLRDQGSFPGRVTLPPQGSSDRGVTGGDSETRQDYVPSSKPDPDEAHTEAS